MGADLQDVSEDTPQEEEFIARYEPIMTASSAVDSAADAVVPAATLPQVETTNSTPVISCPNVVTAPALSPTPERFASSEAGRSETTVPLRRSSRILKHLLRLNL